MGDCGACERHTLRLSGELHLPRHFVADHLRLPLSASVRLEALMVPGRSMRWSATTSSSRMPLRFAQEFTFPVRSIAPPPPSVPRSRRRLGDVGQREAAAPPASTTTTTTTTAPMVARAKTAAAAAAMAAFAFDVYAPVPIVDERQVLLFAFRDTACHLAARVAVTYADGRRVRRGDDDGGWQTAANAAWSLRTFDLLFLGDECDAARNREADCLLHRVARCSAATFRLTRCGRLNYATPPRTVLLTTNERLERQRRRRRRRPRRGGWRKEEEDEMDERPCRWWRSRGGRIPRLPTPSPLQRPPLALAAHDVDDGRWAQGDAVIEAALLRIVTDLSTYADKGRRAAVRPPLIVAGAYKLPFQAIMYDVVRDDDDDDDGSTRSWRGWLRAYRHGRDFAAQMLPRNGAGGGCWTAEDALFLTVEYASGNACATTRPPLANDAFTRWGFPDGADLPSRSRNDKVGWRMAGMRRLWSLAAAAAAAAASSSSSSASVSSSSSSSSSCTAATDHRDANEVLAAFGPMTATRVPGLAVTMATSTTTTTASQRRYALNAALIADQGQTVTVLDDDDDDDKDDDGRTTRQLVAACWTHRGETHTAMATRMPFSDTDDEDSVEEGQEQEEKEEETWRVCGTSRYSSTWTRRVSTAPHRYRHDGDDWRRIWLPALVASSQRRLRPALSERAISEIRHAAAVASSSARGWQGRYLPLGSKPFDPALDLRDKAVVEVQRGSHAPAVNGFTASRRRFFAANDGRDERAAARYVAVW